MTPSAEFSPITAPPKICAVDGMPAIVSKANEVLTPFTALAYSLIN